MAAGALTTFLSLGTILSLPAFLRPIGVDTGWTRASISLAITINMLTMGVASFAWGSLSDRVGPRRVMLTGVVLMALALAIASRASTVHQFQFGYGLLAGVASGCFTAPLTSTVTLWFEKDRALAVSLVSAGLGLGPMILSPTAAHLIGVYGWRAAMMTFAAAIALVLLPVCSLVRRPPESPPENKAGRHGLLLNDASRTALVSTPFLVLAFTFFACCASHSGPIFHTVSYAVGCGLSTMTAVSIYSAESLANVVGRLSFGFLADRIGVRVMIIAGLAVQSIAAGAYAASSQLAEFYATAFVFGLAYGGVMPLYAVMARNCFPPQILGTVMGALMLASGWGMALGPAIGGWIFDTYRSYAGMYIGSLAVGLGAALIAFRLPRSTSHLPAPAHAPGMDPN